MKPLNATFLTLGFSMLGVFQPAQAAWARDRANARAPSGLTQAAGVTALPTIIGADPLTLPAATDPAAVEAAVARGESATKGSGLAVRGSGSSAGSASNSESQVDLDASDDVKVDKLCGEDPQCGTMHQIDLLPEVVFAKMEELPVLGVFVIPVTKGMTLDPGQGLPVVTFAVKPTKITRGSGLVAVAHF
jgi:hypothetical protein